MKDEMKASARASMAKDMTKRNRTIHTYLDEMMKWSSKKEDTAPKTSAPPLVKDM
jgi:hypothetical protein